jgi:D-alanyl-D-alanine carboxypeptidase
MNIVTPQLQPMDEFLTALYPQAGPGAAVLVQKDGQVLLRKGYGLANIELSVPVEPDMVFRIGSVTKQFTAVSILMLLEQGKLSLDDPIEKFLPDYPTHGHTITVTHLLNHTSGIKSFTGMPEFWQNQGKDYTLTELVDFFKHQPMDFAPGKRWAYNNSGYALLGAIIEKVSGLEYAQFLQQHIFEPLGLQHSSYDSATRIIPRRASGYSRGPQGIINAPYISMTGPHGAGALISTVDDLACWNAALDDGRLIKPETLQQAWTPCCLFDGSSIPYGCGWSVGQWAGWQWIEHGGGINGFTCHVLRIPSEQIFVAVLTNSDASQRNPDEVAVRAAGYAAGKPFAEPTLAELAPEQLAGLAGTYQRPGSDPQQIKVVDGHLEIALAPDFSLVYQPLGPLEFVSARSIFSSLHFCVDENGQATAVKVQDRYGIPEEYQRVEPSA